MDKQELFERTKSLWPDAIVFGKDSGGLEALNNIYWPLEEQLAASSDDWMQLAAWAFHQALAELGEIKGTGGKTSLRPTEVTFESFDRQMRMNLSDKSWSGIRKEYVAGLE